MPYALEIFCILNILLDINQKKFVFYQIVKYAAFWCIAAFIAMSMIKVACFYTC